MNQSWGGSSAGRALRSQCRGREFDPPPLHHLSSKDPEQFDGCCGIFFDQIVGFLALYKGSPQLIKED